MLAYGSLIADSGPGLAAVVAERVPARTPFPVEFGRASARWGGGPVLVPHPDGAPVDGMLLVLERGLGLGTAVDLLAEREGAGPECVVEVADGVPAGLMVLCACLPRNLPRPDMAPDALARRAARSAGSGSRNGVAYLRLALSAGIRTPRTGAYAEEVMRLSGEGDLEAAERRLVALSAARRAEGGGASGLG
ncbi:MAG: hypothetical protein MUE51_12790 [Thermoleophilia bacterium]|nr:hypothetical protein [Thermoleophilia bacterium]